ncbi:hypothetical protein ACH4OW_37965 [Streptomyces sp. NPDC017056]|uniref:hypothetical protein n=1 Tax=Streptomyces sp. NPDC017056 TaxID=3364973 RepID=UPI003789EE29
MTRTTARRAPGERHPHRALRPQGLIEAVLPLDRAPYGALVTAVLAWKDPDLAPGDYEQSALHLTGHARAVAADVRRLAAALPKSDGRGAFAEVILREAAGRIVTVDLDAESPHILVNASTGGGKTVSYVVRRSSCL